MAASISPSPTILLPLLPPNTIVGIDLITFTSTPNFHGIRDLPVGWHFLYTGTTESLSLRSGGWFHIGSENGDKDEDIAPVDTLAVGPRGAATEVLIWKWDSETETLASLDPANDADKQEALRWKANLGAVWQAGGLFRYRSRVSVAQSHTGNAVTATDDNHETETVGRRDWERLTDCLSSRLLTRVIGDPRADIDGRLRWTVTSASSAVRDNDDIPGLAPEDSSRVTGEAESAFGFLPVDLKRTWREGAIGRERTEAAQDRSWALGEMLRQVVADGSGPGSGSESERAAERQVLGELQFTFLMGLTLVNYSCLQQWKRLLELVLTCQRAIRDRERFMSDVLRLLLVQLKRCDDIEGGLFDLDGEEGGEFLRNLLVKFRRSLYEVVSDGDGAGSTIEQEFARLEAWVHDEYNWELNREAVVRRGMVRLEDGEEVELEMNDDDGDDEIGEYAPMVVDVVEDAPASIHDDEASDNDDPRM
ncbi:A1 cistron-splicing factor [Aspergillus ambiguus]|uniref:AAR2 splicing factor family protein n=1 Tax=Aspergillus ambiguus TaxID=176160 RepID=UPI003CCC9916